MFDEQNINLLEELDNISKIHTLEREDIDAIMVELAKRIVKALKIERMSVWLFNQERDALISMGEYDSRNHHFAKESVLARNEFPTYFDSLEKNKILLAEKINENEFTYELKDKYAIPNNVVSLMDIPIRIGGVLVGVMCFEKTGIKKKKFSVSEQSFAFSISLVFASNLEARQRRAIQFKLNNALKEKELLIKEIHHRVKNNFSILISLLRLSKENEVKLDPKIILDEFEQRIFSMMKIQDLLIESKNHSEVPIAIYLEELIKEFKLSHPELKAAIISNIEKSSVGIHSRLALHIGLIVTEVFLNSIKHSKNKEGEYFFQFNFFHSLNGQTILEIEDSGPGFDFEEKLKGKTLGISLIKDLSNDVGIKFIAPKPGNSTYTFEVNL